ncbi:reductase-like protein [Atractiella rhizophila]|nr:reductase-like protein [Atractiella rhizophila]
MDIPGLFSVTGKVVVVTGGGKGIGLMISTAFVSAGCKVYIISRDLKSLQATADSLNKLSQTKGNIGQCIALQADLQKLDHIEKVVKEIESKEKAIHVLVNNSGANWGEELASYPDAAFTKVVNLNLQRVFTLTQKLLPLLMKGAVRAQDGSFSDPARIINIGSVDGIRVPSLETYAYSASKAALHHLSKVLAVRLGPEGITSNAIAAGPFETKMMKATLEAGRESIVGANPMLRIGTPEDIGALCIFLSARSGSYVNGAIIPLDGGVVIAGKL